MARVTGPVRALLVLTGCAVIAQVALGVLGGRSLAAEILAAFAIDLLASRFGAGFYGDEAGASSKLGRAFARGSIVGLAAVACAVIVGLAARQARVEGVSISSLSVVLAAASALATAIRRELLYRWIPWRLAGPTTTPRDLGIFTIVLGAAPIAFAAPFRPAALALSLGMGALSVALIHKTKGLVASIAAHAVVLLATSTLLSSVLDLRWNSGALTPMENASGPGAWLLAATLALAALWVARSARAV